MKTIIIIWLSVLIIGGLSGCTSAPLYNPSIEYPAQNINNVEDALLKGLANRQWLPKKESPGLITATLNLRQHQATIQINYFTTGYSIKLINSKMLDYEKDATGKESIHGNYNKWIEYLINDINTVLGIPTYTKYNSTINDEDDYRPIQTVKKAPANYTTTLVEKQPTSSSQTIVDQLKKLKELKDSGLLTDSEFELKRKALVDKL